MDETTKVAEPRRADEGGNRKKNLFLGLAVLAVMGAIILLTNFNRAYSYQGSVINPPAPAADIQLKDQLGQPFQLSAAQSGKVTLLFFGFTNCTDVCPVTLSTFKQVKARLGQQANQVRFIFVTVDPERDSASVMKNYLNQFDPSFIGLTGARAELELVWNAYGVYAATEGTAAFEQVAHSSDVYVIDQKDQLRMTYPGDADAPAIAQDVAHMLHER